MQRTLLNLPTDELLTFDFKQMAFPNLKAVGLKPNWPGNICFLILLLSMKNELAGNWTNQTKESERDFSSEAVPLNLNTQLVSQGCTQLYSDHRMNIHSAIILTELWFSLYSHSEIS